MFPERIAFFCNDAGEYGILFEQCSQRIGNIRGRCIIEWENRYLECQIFLAFDGEREVERTDCIRNFIYEINKRQKGDRAAPIPTIPGILTAEYIRLNYGSLMQENCQLAAGLFYDTVAPMILDLRELGELAISGSAESGADFVMFVVRMLQERDPSRSEVYIMDGIKRRLARLRDSPNVVSYEILPEKIFAVLEHMEDKLRKRYELAASGELDFLADSSLLLLILNHREAVEAICGNVTALERYKNITGKYRHMNVCVLIGDYENEAVSYQAPELMKRWKEARHFLFYGNLWSMKILDLPLSVTRSYRKPIEPGDCYYIKGNDCRKVKTVLKW